MKKLGAHFYVKINKRTKIRNLSKKYNVNKSIIYNLIRIANKHEI
ncbi:hypothetical protein ACW95P_04370 [Candidatus Mycoplasma pogonae]